ncbi:MAG: hypothetical protein WBX25_35425 [Rhodomicrobium sp.]
MSERSYSAASAAQRAWWDDLYQLDRTPIGFDRIQVHDAGNECRRTGLLDARGNELYRVIKKHPIGFTVPKDEY